MRDHIGQRIWNFDGDVPFIAAVGDLGELVGSEGKAGLANGVLYRLFGRRLRLDIPNGARVDRHSEIVADGSHEAALGLRIAITIFF